MRLVFINRFYWPETPATGQLLTDLAEFLAAAGHDVTVITSHSGAGGLPAKESRNGVAILRVRGTRWTRAGLIGKAADWGTFYIRALWRLFCTARREATVVAMTDPPLLGLGAWLAARWRGAKIVHWVQDIYPELAIELTGQQWLRAVRPLRDLSWRRADRCVTLGEDMAAAFAEARVVAGRRSVIPNWPPATLAPPPREAADALRHAWGLTGKFVVAYSGNLGRVHDLDPVLDIADRLRLEPSIEFVFVGGGAQREALEHEAARRQLANVSFHPSQPRAGLAASLAAADLHLVTLRPGCERLVFPSKLYGIAAIGRPVLFIGPAKCEVAAIIRNRGMGVVAERGDSAGMAGAIRRLQQDGTERARLAAAAARFGAEHGFSPAAARWRELLESMNACGPASMAVTTLPAR